MWKPTEHKERRNLTMDTDISVSKANGSAAAPAPYGTDENILLGFVGDRVRKARVSKKLSRKALSELSGVSQRYLAQLEAGSGNISVLLLYRIASALGENIHWFLKPEIQHETRVSKMVAALQSASEEQHRLILNILEPQKITTGPARRLAFIGLRGAGKSTLGRMVAQKTGLPFRELNDDIEKVSGIPVNEVMALYGIEGYRKLELQSLNKIIKSQTSLVLAVAGGIVNEAATYRLLLDNCTTIWLKARPEDHMARVRGQGDERPMAGNPDAMKQLKNIWSEREKNYARADVVVDTSGKTIQQSLSDILRALYQR